MIIMEKVVERKVKLIWDFRGTTAAQLAMHYQKHLEEFAVVEELKFEETGVQHLSSLHSVAFLVTTEFEAKAVGNLLKPHRGEYLSE